jgi:pimeloyl-ACP methyl ester carboxylesterase
MQRPVMDITFLQEPEAKRPKKPRTRIWPLVRRILKLFGRFLVLDVFGYLRGPRLRVEDGTPFGRFTRALLYRLAFVPMVLVGTCFALVYAATHPPRVAVGAVPEDLRLYFEPVSLVSPDKTRLEALMVPVIDAQRVLAEKEQVLRKKHAAVILVHSMGATGEQMLPLVRPLHEAGLTVLVVNVRGSGLIAPAPQTFGLTEAMDVQTAVDFLSQRPSVDPSRIALVGVGSGANAALLAAKRDVRVCAVVLSSPLTSDDVMERFISRKSPLHWLQPLCRYTFELGYRVDMNDLNLERYGELLKTRPVLMLGASISSTGIVPDQEVRQIELFLKRHLGGARLLLVSSSH